MADESLDVVIVSFRRPDLVRACLASLREHAPTRVGMTVHVVDNASGDETPDMVASEFPEVRLWRLESNVGFSAANNLPLAGSTADYALILNPDTELRAGVIDHLIGTLHERPDVGMIGCRLVQLDGTFDHAAKRSFPTPAAALGHFTGLGRSADRGALSGYRATAVEEDGVGEVDAINGAFMLVRSEAVREVGLFDEGYWLYMEDLDWCARFWEHGWKVLYDGRVTAIHVKGGSAGSFRAARTNIHFHRGMGRFYRRHQGGRSTALDVAVYCGIGVKLALSLARSAVGRELQARRPRSTSL